MIFSINMPTVADNCKHVMEIVTILHSNVYISSKTLNNTFTHLSRYVIDLWIYFGPPNDQKITHNFF